MSNSDDIFKYRVNITLTVTLDAFDEDDAIDQAKEVTFLDLSNQYVKNADIKTERLSK